MRNQVLTIGQEVVNFGNHAIVWKFHEITGDPILRDAAGNKWLAQAEKCEPCGLGHHKSGLVVVG